MKKQNEKNQIDLFGSPVKDLTHHRVYKEYLKKEEVQFFKGFELYKSEIEVLKKFEKLTYVKLLFKGEPPPKDWRLWSKSTFMITAENYFVKKLIAQNCHLTSFPKLITKLSNLKTLDLTNNKIYNIPEFITELNSLEKLVLKKNGLNKFPDVLFKLKNLKQLFISQNQISEIPERIKELPLNTLELGAKYLKGLPNSLAQLSSLKNFSISVTRDFIFSYGNFSQIISKLKNLKNVRFSNVRLHTFPEYLTKMITLESIDLFDNRIQTIPPSIQNLRNLKKLKLGVNSIPSIPDSIRKLSMLEVLDLYDNDLSEFPEVITTLISLQVLHLGSNSLETIPNSIGNLINLRELNLGNNEFKTIPKSIGNLKNLKKLHLYSDRISELPEELFNLTLLEHLNLHSNYIRIIPESISKLTNLRKLQLDYNHSLRNLPESIAKLKKLKSLSLEGIYSLKLPKALTQESSTAVKGGKDIEYDTQGNFTLSPSLGGYSCPSVARYSDPNSRRQLLNPDEIIIIDENIKIEFTYPLSVKEVFEYENKGGFTRMDLWRCIYEGYTKIYEEEEKAAGDPGSVPGMLNRAESSGPYGIWGHDLGELHIERIKYNQNLKLITLFIGS